MSSIALCAEDLLPDTKEPHVLTHNGRQFSVNVSPDGRGGFSVSAMIDGGDVGVEFGVTEETITSMARSVLMVMVNSRVSETVDYWWDSLSLHTKD
jgi:hypothetical protein